VSCPPLYTPPDVWPAHDVWQANCGPGALAAVLGVPVMQLRDAFPSFPKKPWTTPTSMQAALTARRAAFRACDGFSRTAARGLLFIQLRGPWDSAPERAQYRHTHWVGTSGVGAARQVYDVNAGDAGGWLSAEGRPWHAAPRRRKQTTAMRMGQQAGGTQPQKQAMMLLLRNGDLSCIRRVTVTPSIHCDIGTEAQMLHVVVVVRPLITLLNNLNRYLAVAIIEDGAESGPEVVFDFTVIFTRRRNVDGVDAGFVIIKDLNDASAPAV